MTASVARHHAEWLSLIEVSGPFLTVPVLRRALPQGLEPVDSDLAAEVRRAHDEWRDDPDLHGQWVQWVLISALGFDGETLLEGPSVPATLTYTAAEHGETLRPDLTVCEPGEAGKVEPRLLIAIWPEDARLDERISGRRWSAAPLDRMTDLLRATGVRLGLVTNGERWTLVHAPASGPTAYASWDADLWLEERSTLDAFTTFLSARRFFGVPDGDTLEALLEESANAEQEVTDQLGRQVRQAVELLVDAFGRADREHGGTFLARIEPQEIYLAAVTVMMRLVFLLSAEERGLFLLGDPLYDSSYAVSTLRSQLQEEADRFGEEPLERRSSAWYRTLGSFRLVYAGVQHENLRLPAYGGSLFDPDRFPFLEGRGRGDAWRDDPGRPLPVDDRTLLHILDALQVLRFRVGRGVSEARRLSFRALDVEQIGHVYEGLLDHTAVRTTDPAVGLDGKLEPEVALAELEERTHQDHGVFLTWLAELTGRTTKSIEKALGAPIEPHRKAQLLASCDNDQRIADRVAPFHALLRDDLRGLPQTYVADSFYVTKAGERRSSGTYYTPRSLAEEMVEHALAPLVYQPGPAEGADPGTWKLKSPARLLELKICDLAMGSGAFLVAATRYLAERLVEAWAGAEPEPVTAEGNPAPSSHESIPEDPDDQLILARRLVADRCIYGVDKNPMAVEMAKLSMWLITLAKDRPFSFLDHALRPGDSLLGIHDLAQIEHLHPDPKRGRELHTTLEEPWHSWQAALKKAIERRRELESFTVLSVRDAALKERLFREASGALDDVKVAADVIIGAALSSAREGNDKLDSRLLGVAGEVATAIDPAAKDDDRRVRLENLRTDALYSLNEGKPAMQSDRQPFHWPLEFPEVFIGRGGFDAIVGNPPFLGGMRVSPALGYDYTAYLKRLWPHRAGHADLAAYFFLRAVGLSRTVVSLVATNSISEGDTREVGLAHLLSEGSSIYRATRDLPWPGSSNLSVSLLWIRRGAWQGSSVLDGRPVSAINSRLEPSQTEGDPYRLIENKGLISKGTGLVGIGFVVDDELAQSWLALNSGYGDILCPYLNAEDFNRSPDQHPTRWVINFDEWEMERARTYPLAFERVTQLVKPVRDNITSQIHERDYWKFWDKRKELYRRINQRPISRVLVCPVVTGHIVWAFVAPTWIYSNEVYVFPNEEAEVFGVLQSSLHVAWVVRMTSRLGTGLRYTATDSFQTFPFPGNLHGDAELRDASEQLHSARSSLMVSRGWGLTAVYNAIHDSSRHDPELDDLRALGAELDRRVAATYGWSDLNLEHDFREVPDGVRHTIEPATRAQILDRLLTLNHERHQQELSSGLKAKKRDTRGTRKGAGHPTLEGTT